MSALARLYPARRRAKTRATGTGRGGARDIGMAVILLGAAVAGFVQGMSGFAFGLVAMAFWSWVLEPAVAGPLVVFCSIIGQGMGMRSLKVSAIPRAIPFILGGLVGVPLGVVVLPRVNPQMFQAGLGALLLVWCPAMLLATKLPRIAHGGRWPTAWPGRSAASWAASAACRGRSRRCGACCAAGTGSPSAASSSWSS